MSIDTYFCFCCLSTNDLSPLYNDAGTNHGNTLLNLLNLNISLEDYEFDGYICKECAQRLKEANEFKTQVFDILNILQNNGLIELIKTDQTVNVKKVNNVNVFESEEKYDTLVKDVFPYKEAEEQIGNQTPVKKEPAQEKKLQIERDKITIEEGQKISHYEVTEDLKCPICAKVMPTVYVYHSHMNQHFPNHICDVCGKGFMTEKRLKRHMPSHRTGPFRCQQCDQQFTNYNTFNSHRQRKHSSVPLYACPECPERFGTLTRRALHRARHHARAPAAHACRVCGAAFLLAGNLSSHIRNTHQKVKRPWNSEQESIPRRPQDMFHCAQCPKRYPRKKALIVHMRTHTNDKRFSCEFCGKRFVQKCTLLVHVKIHNREAEKTGVAAK